MRGGDGVTEISGRGGMKKYALRKAVCEIPIGREFHALDVQEIISTKYKRAFLSARAIGFYLSKMDAVQRAGKRTWVKVREVKE